MPRRLTKALMEGSLTHAKKVVKALWRGLGFFFFFLFVIDFALLVEDLLGLAIADHQDEGQEDAEEAHPGHGVAVAESPGALGT